MSAGSDRTTVVIDPDTVDVSIVSLELGNPVDRKHARAAARWLSWLVVAATTVGAAGTALVPDLLRGPAVMDGSARGTALVLLVLTVPVLVTGSILVGRDVPVGHVLRAGALAHVLYNAVLLCFGTPFNDLFPAYVAMLGLAFWGLLASLLSTPYDDRWRPGRARAVAAYVLVLVALNLVAWLARIVPALGDATPDLLEGTGLTTNPVIVQDLAVWLPFMAAGGLMLWTRHAWGLLVAGAGLVYWQLEAATVAVDQWLGHRADPASSVASTAGAALFLGVLVVGFLPTWAVLRQVSAR